MKITDEGVPLNTLIEVVKASVKRAGVSRTSQARDLQRVRLFWGDAVRGFRVVRGLVSGSPVSVRV